MASAEEILNNQEDEYNQDEVFEEDEDQNSVDNKNKSSGDEEYDEEEEEVEDLPDEEEEENEGAGLEDKNEEFEEEPIQEDDDDDANEDDANDGDVQAVTVLVRIRPLLEDEEYTPEGEKTSIAVSLPHKNDRNKIRVIAKEGTQFESILECGYDRVLDMDTTQTEVFESTAIKPAVLGVAHGISACVFA